MRVTHLADGLSNSVYFVTRSQDGKHEAWFVLEGFQDRGWTLFVRSDPKAEPKPVARLDWDVCRFTGAEWSRDGKVVVATLDISPYNGQRVTSTVYDKSRKQLAGVLPDGQRIYPCEREVRAYAYDYSQGQPLLPPGATCGSLPTVVDWLDFESNVVSLVDEHGGFDGKPIGRNHMERLAKPIGSGKLRE
jgi:hypothetical protein